MKTIQALMLAGSLFGALGCEEEEHPCNEQVRANEPFTVKVTARSDPDTDPLPWFLVGLPPCGLEDVEVGDAFPLELTRHVPYGNACYHYTCPRGFPTPATEGAWSGGYGLPYVCVQDRAKVRLDDACALGRFVAVYNPGGVKAFYETPDDPNEHRLVRALTASSEGECPGLVNRYPEGALAGGFVCADQWQVRLQPRATD